MERIIKKIAYDNCVSESEVRLQIEDLALKGFRSTNPNVRLFWESMPRQRELPTAEEIISHLSGLAFIKMFE